MASVCGGRARSRSKNASGKSSKSKSKSRSRSRSKSKSKLKKTPVKPISKPISKTIVNPSKSEKTHKLNVMTFNILADICIDFANPSEYYHGIKVEDLKIERRLPKIHEHLVEVAADIIMLQEITPDVRDFLIKNMPDYTVEAFSRHIDETLPAAQTKGRANAYGNTTILKKGLFTNIKHSTKYLNNSGTAFDITECIHKETKKPILIINLHLDSESGILRSSESESALNFLKPYYKTHCIIVAGDFNTDDATLHKKYNKFESAVKQHTSTYLCEKPMIDYIYFYGFKVLKGKVDNSPCGKTSCMQKTLLLHGSDHYSVLAEVLI